MPPRIYFDTSIAQAAQTGVAVPLPEDAARHVQVLRLQPGDALTLFDGHGGEWSAEVERMGRRDVDVRVGEQRLVDRELPLSVTLAIGMPANERMDALVEKATELGAAAFVPLICERSVLRLSGERAERKVDHWRGVARSACEQSGRTKLPVVGAMQNLAAWLRDLPEPGDKPEIRWLLSLRDAESIHVRLREGRPLSSEPGASLLVLSGPEGGFTESEEAAARERGFNPISLGPRVLRADTAPLAVLACVGQAVGVDDPSVRS
jgi:16S rRNA (uracil1498-N3)-methyltransferase